MGRRILLAVLGVSLLGLAGCPELKDLRRQNANLEKQLQLCQRDKEAYSQQAALLQAERDQLKTDLGAARHEAAQRGGLVDTLRAEHAKLEQQRQELQSLLRDLHGISVQAGPEGNFVVMENDVLFALGKAELNEDAKESLTRVATYFRDRPELTVRIDGHTDGVPVKVSGWEDNYHLAVMRAHAVMKYLTQKGVSAERMYIAGYGPNKPRTAPETPAAPVAENRRVEILVIPEGSKRITDILRGFQE
jgi:chemotaxis protein MotB